MSSPPPPPRPARAPLLVGIAGPSGSGKSWVATKLQETFSDASSPRILVLPVDAYYFGCSSEEAPTYDFDTPRAIDMALLAEHLDALREGRPFERPVYDFATHSRTDRTVPIAPRYDVVLIEGLFALASEEIRARCDLLAYVEERESVCLKRRILRDVVERGRDFRDALDHLDAINRGLDRYIAPSREHATVAGCSGWVIVELVKSINERVEA